MSCMKQTLCLLDMDALKVFIARCKQDRDYVIRSRGDSDEEAQEILWNEHIKNIFSGQIPDALDQYLFPVTSWVT